MAHRVLYISPLPPPAGGVANWTRILFERGLPEGWEPLLVDTRATLSLQAGAMGRLRPQQLRRWARILRETSAALRRDRPDIVHLNVHAQGIGLLRDAMCAGLARRHGVPYVVNYRGNVAVLRRREPTSMQRRLLRRIARHAALNLVLNAEDKAFLEGELAGESRVVQIANFFDDREIAVSVPRPLREGERPRGIFVGGLTRAKGVHLICAAAARLPEVDFVLLGGRGPETAADIEAAPENVEVPGEVDHAGVVDALARSHLFVFPTTHDEGFPNAVCEAMASALPVVAYPMGAIGEMVDDGVGGVILPDLDVDTLVAAIERVLADEERRQAMGRHNLVKARALYAYPSVVRRLMGLYGEVIGEGD